MSVKPHKVLSFISGSAIGELADSSNGSLSHAELHLQRRQVYGSSSAPRTRTLTSSSTPTQHTSAYAIHKYHTLSYVCANCTSTLEGEHPTCHPSARRQPPLAGHRSGWHPASVRQ